MKKIGIFGQIIIFTVLFCTACSLGNPSTVSGASAETGFVAAVAGNYDSADTAVLLSRDTEAMTMCFLNLELGKRYTLYYDGATTFDDKYGQGISLEQVQDGDVVNVTFMKDRKRLNSLQLSVDTFVMPQVENFMIAANGRTIVLNGEEYTCSKDLVVLSDQGVGELMDVNSVDLLRICGSDHTIYSINVIKGHGYLRLENDSYFIGGWIEVNQKQICPIESDMLLAVPEGTYPITVSNSGSTGTATVTITRNEEYSLDVSEWQGETKYGDVIFTVTPDSARIYVDGNVVDISEAVNLPYGIHQLIVMADGYTTISKYIKVQNENSNINIVMEQAVDATTSPSVSTNSNISANTTVSENVSENTTPATMPTPSASPSASVSVPPVTPTETPSMVPSASPSPSSLPSLSPTASPAVASNTYQVTITAPEGVEVYKDGSYIGIAPISFPKVAGSYVITLRRDGYQTRSYTITVDDAAKDISYSFSALLPI